MTMMSKYDYSRVPEHLLATLGRAHFARTLGASDPREYQGAYSAALAAARVPERTRAELAEELLQSLERCLNPECTGGFTFSDDLGDEIRALVNAARTAPITPR